MKSFAVFMITALLVTPTLSASELISDKKLVKCYVEVLGGNRFIHYKTATEEQVATVSTTLTGQQVHVPGFKDKLAIHKVMECKLATEKFKAGRARFVEEQQAK